VAAAAAAVRRAAAVSERGGESLLTSNVPLAQLAMRMSAASRRRRLQHCHENALSSLPPPARLARAGTGAVHDDGASRNTARFVRADEGAVRDDGDLGYH